MSGLAQLADQFGGELNEAVQLIRSSTGQLVVTGIGKSGLVGAKLAATFASTGTPTFFLHAAETAHGDLGMIVRGDPDDLPIVAPEAPIQEVIVVLSEGRKGCVVVIESDRAQLVGIITEGDLRRAHADDVFSKRACEIL